MKQVQKAKRARRSAAGRQEPLAADLRDRDIVHAHRITLPAADRITAGGRGRVVPHRGR